MNLNGSYFGVDHIAVRGGKVLVHGSGVTIIDTSTNTVVGTIPISNDGSSVGIAAIPK